MNGESVECRNQHRFNIFAIYKDFYEQIPLATRIGDYLSKAVFQDFEVNGNPDEEETIASYFERQNFRELFERIVLDSIIYGSSILSPDSTNNLRRVELADAEITIGLGRIHGGQAVHQLIRSITTSKGEIDVDAMIHFRHNPMSELFGQSAYGMWFDHFYTIKEAPRALTNASIEESLGLDRGALGTLEAIRDYFEQAVLTGAGLPNSLMSSSKPSTTPLPMAKRGSPLSLDIEARQRELEETVEREIFPLVLRTEWDYENYPKFAVIGQLRLI